MISGGATGGHITPALAVAQALRAEEPDAAILLVGKRGGPEERQVPEAGFDLETVRVQGFDRDAPWRNLALPFVLPGALAEGRRIVRDFRPDVVLGTGGYVMVPALSAARRAGVPYVLLVSEPRGLANRLFYRRSAAACLSLPDRHGRVRSKRVEVTGFPLRPGFRPASPAAPPRRLLVLGGSLGARNLNRAVWGALEGLLQRFDEVVHVAGRQAEADLPGYQRPGYRGMLFTDEMQELMAAADLVVSRAGVGTISEITACGLPAVLVPGTFAGAHQEDNAALLAAEGAAIRVGDSELTPARLLEVLDSLTPDQLRAMAAASGRLGKPDAAQRVVQVLREVAA
ncbi:MAG TPA: UDP-N-acetylglucosamine--N-acetylmuramyl-(pentapeptide) pyrophosphoryl-undecaprenol N-acetylglucosamine transferase [Candidatus Dormibacteraeota bacterium]